MEANRAGRVSFSKERVCFVKKEGEYAMSIEQTQKGPLERFLRGVEILGNKIPNPMLLFISLCIIVIAASAICSIFDVSAVNPVTGEVVKVVNLFSRDGFVQMLTKFVSNFTGTSAMGLTLTCMLGVGVAEASGLFHTALHGLAKAKGSDLKVIVIFTFVCIMADCAGGAGFVGHAVHKGDVPFRVQLGKLLPAGLQPLAAVLGLVLGRAPDHQADAFGIAVARTARQRPCKTGPRQGQGKGRGQFSTHLAFLHPKSCCVKKRSAKSFGKFRLDLAIPLHFAIFK